MNIQTPPPHRTLRVRHQTRVRRLSVIRAETLTPHMRRVVLGGEALEGFVSAAADDHVKLFLPAPGQDEPVLPTLGPNGPVFSDGAIRPIARDYTVRFFDPAKNELTIDFLLHGDGPAASWAARARLGQVVGIGGPRGSLLAPGDYDCYLLAGDQSALPAIGRRLEELPTGTRAIVIVEIADEAEQRYLPSAASLSITWLSRRGGAEPMLGALRDLDWPPGDVHAWMAGELGVIGLLREHLITRRGIGRDHIRASGYWKHGAVASHGRIED